MKRIEFTPGIEAMRGSFSPRQKLLYALNDNPAFDAPLGRQYARNYQANFVGAKRSATGLKYFFTKTKSATLVTAENKLRMAITGAAGAIFADIQRNATTANSIYYRLQYSWKNYFKSPKTFRAWCMEYLQSMLSSKLAFVNMGRDAQSEIVNVHNPWFVRERPQTAYVPQIAAETLAKFWPQLAANDDGDAGIVFTVDSQNGVAFANDTFGAFSTDAGLSNYNLLKLVTDGVTDYMRLGSVNGPYVVLAGTYITTDSVITANAKYTTTEVAPEP